MLKGQVNQKTLLPLVSNIACRFGNISLVHCPKEIEMNGIVLVMLKDFKKWHLTKTKQRPHYYVNPHISLQTPYTLESFCKHFVDKIFFEWKC